jgi:hypothetical protein
MSACLGELQCPTNSYSTHHPPSIDTAALPLDSCNSIQTRPFRPRQNTTNLPTSAPHNNHPPTSPYIISISKLSSSITLKIQLPLHQTAISTAINPRHDAATTPHNNHRQHALVTKPYITSISKLSSTITFKIHLPLHSTPLIPNHSHQATISMTSTTPLLLLTTINHQHALVTKPYVNAIPNLINCHNLTKFNFHRTALPLHSFQITRH